MVNPALRRPRRRFHLGRRFSYVFAERFIVWPIHLRLTEFVVRRRLLPSVWDLCFVAGLILVGWVLYQLTPLLAESWLALLLILTGTLHGISRGDR